MNLEEYAKLMRKKKPRRLVDIEIEEISLVSNPAIRKLFYIKKRSQTMKDFDEVLDLVASFLSDDELEKSEGVDTGKLKEAMHVITDSRDDLPDKLRSAISIVLKWAASYGPLTKKSETDPFPSIPIMVPSSTIEKMVGEDISDENEENDENSEWG